MAGRPPLSVIDAPPDFARPRSQACTARQFADPAMYFWTNRLRIDHRLHRETWERCFIAQALARAGHLAPGRTGLALQAVDLQLASIFRALGARLLITHTEADRVRQWAGEHSADAVFPWGFAQQDPMAASDGPGRFDFLWSSKTLSQCGGVAAGRRFLDAALTWLVPGGMAVFSLDYLCEVPLSDDPAWWNRHHLLTLLSELADRGYHVAVNINLGEDPPDADIDRPPYRSAPHLKLMMGDRLFTSFCLIVSRKDVTDD